MTTAATVVSLWAGASLLVSALGPVRRPSLHRRLRPYLVTPSTPRPAGTGRLGPVSVLLGDRLARALGATESLDRRLRRVHHELDPTAFRYRQVSRSVLGLGVAGLVIAAVPRPPSPVLTIAMVLGAPVVVLLAHEHALNESIRRRSRLVLRELPTVAEQLAMHLAAGRSVSATVAHLGAHGHGACAQDLARVTRRLQQGVDEHEALREWADLTPEPAVGHLVGVLTLAHDATDLDRLVEQEAEAVRSEVHRHLLGDLERRSQQVWVPVTVATLLPGSLLLLVPFLDALRLFAGP